MMDADRILSPRERAKKRIHTYKLTFPEAGDPIIAAIDAVPFGSRLKVCYEFLVYALKIEAIITNLEVEIDNMRGLAKRGQISQECADREIKQLDDDCYRFANDIKNKHLGLRTSIVETERQRS